MVFSGNEYLIIRRDTELAEEKIKNMKLDELTKIIIGLAIKIHRNLGGCLIFSTVSATELRYVFSGQP